MLSPAISFMLFSVVLGPVALMLWTSNVGQDPLPVCLTGTPQYNDLHGTWGFGGLRVPLQLHSRRVLQALSSSGPGGATTVGTLGTTGKNTTASGNAAAAGNATATATAGGHSGRHNPFASSWVRERQSKAPTFPANGYKSRRDLFDIRYNRRRRRARRRKLRQRPDEWWNFNPVVMHGDGRSRVDAAWRMRIWLFITGIGGCCLGVFEFFVIMHDLVHSKDPAERLLGTAPRQWQVFDVVGVFLLLSTAVMCICWLVVGSDWAWGPDGAPCRGGEADKLWYSMNSFLIGWWLLTVLSSIGLSVNPVVLGKAPLLDLLTSWSQDHEKPRGQLRFTPGYGAPVAASGLIAGVPLN